MTPGEMLCLLLGGGGLLIGLAGLALAPLSTRAAVAAAAGWAVLIAAAAMAGAIEEADRLRDAAGAEPER